MIKNFIKKHKSQVLKYCIEIFVIVIGILGAFALDNWNQNRANKILERGVLTQIDEDLIDILADLKNDFIIHDIALNSHFTLTQLINNTKPYNENMTFDFYWIKEDEYIFPNRTGYETLTSYGTNLITNQKLRTYISYVYNHDFPRITKGNNLYPDINDFLSPYYQKNFKINTNSSLKYVLTLNDNYIVNYPKEIKIGEHSTTEFIGFTPINLSKTLTDDEFKYLLSESQKYRRYKYRMYKNTIENTEKLHKMITEYLNKTT